MKKTITVLLCGIALSSSAQIVLDASNTPLSPTYKLYRYYNNAGISIPVEGTNQTYDYSGLPSLTGNNINNFLPATRAGFTGFTRYNIATNDFASFDLESEYYTHKDATGILAVGSYKLPQKVELGGISGNPADTLAFPGGSSIFTNPLHLLKFPTSYGMSWNEMATYDTDFLISIAGFGLNNTPGNQKQVVNNTLEAVGWGNLILPTANGPSIPYEVLLIKHQQIYVDSFYLAGAPAPTALLTAFGVAQADTSYQNSYKFYAKEQEAPLYTIFMSDDWSYVRFSFYNPAALQPLGIESGLQLSIKEVNAYPNPAKANSYVQFEGIENAKNVEISIFSMAGKLIYKGLPEQTGSKDVKWLIPNNIKNGVYQYSLYSKESNELFSGRIIIQ